MKSVEIKLISRLFPFPSIFISQSYLAQKLIDATYFLSTFFIETLQILMLSTQSTVLEKFCNITSFTFSNGGRDF
jgi:hypothetical protein